MKKTYHPAVRPTKPIPHRKPASRPRTVALLARVKAILDQMEYGAITALADEIGVRRSDLYDWMANRGFPNGESTLALEEWVKKNHKRKSK